MDWDDEAPEPAWGSALVMRDVGELRMSGFRGRPGGRDAALAIVKERVKEALP